MGVGLKRAIGATWCLGMSIGLGCSSPAEPPPAGAAEQALGEDEEEIVDVYVVLHGPSAVEAVGPAAGSGAPDAIRRTRKRLTELTALHDSVRPRLLGLGATITTDLRRLLNGFQIRVPRSALARIEAYPEVESVQPVPIFRRSLHSSIPVVGAPGAWTAATPLHGEGVSVGIMDTGVDYLHADFGGLGDPDLFDKDDPTVVEAGSFPTARVVGGYDFAGNEYDPGNGADDPAPDEDPIDCGGHGSHVAGIAAGGGVLLDGSAYTGPYDMSFDVTQFRIAPGVAPLADLYSLKVFGCDGSTRLVAAALEWAADPDDDGDFSDHLDVINASLGSPYGIPNPANGNMLRNYHAVGGLFVAAAGNEGHTFFITGSPASFPESLSVAATIDNTFIVLRVDSPLGIAGDYASVEAGFTASLRESGAVSGELAYAQPTLGCEPFDNPSEVAGKIALIDRGNCLFYDKLANAAAAGAIGAVVVNNNFDNPFTMATSPEGGLVDIPAVMIRLLDGDLMKQAMLSQPVTVSLTHDSFGGEGSELMAGFSSRGPSSLDGRLKPEIAAPGVAIDSVAVGTGAGPTSKQGTSMATPFVAGAAALVRQAHPSMTPSQVKAVLMNSSTPIASDDGDTYPISMQGSGRLDVVRATEQVVTASVEDADGTVAITFDVLASAEPASTERTVHVTNHGDAAVSFALSTKQVHALDGVQVSVSPAELTVAPGASEPITVTLDLDPELLADPAADPVTPVTQSTLPRHFLDEADGHLLLEDVAGGSQSMVLPFYGIVRAADALTAAPAHGCALETGEVAAITFVGDSAHPKPLISAFELGGIDPVALEIQPKEYDITAFGVATDAAVTTRFDEVSVHFGVAVEGEWTTPARGGSQSVVGIAIDADQDGGLDYALRIEPLNSDDPFYDVIATSVYDLNEGGRVGSKRYVNLVPANEGDTNPFFNSVIVISAFAHDIGLTEEDTVFDYSAFSEGPLGLVQQTATATFDVSQPRVDPARGAPDPGLPLYTGDDVVIAHLGQRDAGNLLPPLLLLHHNGPRGARFETVDVSSYLFDSIGLTHTFASSFEQGAHPAGKIEITNAGEVVVHDVTVSGDIVGGAASLLAPSHGDCDDGPNMHCELGSIPPGAKRSITVQLAPSTSAASIRLDLTIRSATGCEVPFAASFEIVDKTEEPPPYEAGGGCGCSVPTRDDDAWPLIALLGLGALRRRKPVAC